ncbi:MAG TPA: DUF4126 domain-containing protein [Pelomicrobium sp.]|nr:DUF4126 domain-containing protein [Pelomicrobium sp.]
MELLAAHLPEIAVAAGLAWASGLRLYFVLLAVGLAGRYGGVDLPTHLEVLESPLVLGAAGFMVLTEFFADKIPWLDSVWDAIHTFIRIPAGAALAAAVFGDSGEGVALAAALLGGTLAASSHFTKAGSRALINTSPEPVSNVAASFTEEALVAAGLWTAFHFPLLFVALLIAFLAIAGFAAVRLVAALRAAARRWRGEPPPLTGRP